MQGKRRYLVSVSRVIEGIIPVIAKDEDAAKDLAVSIAESHPSYMDDQSNDVQAVSCEEAHPHSVEVFLNSVDEA